MLHFDETYLQKAQPVRPENIDFSGCKRPIYIAGKDVSDD